MMQLSDDIALQPQGAVDQGSPRSEILIAGRPTGSVVPGSVLEAAVRCAPGWLLFVIDDTPYEEMLAIYLIDAQGRLLDSAHIGGPYTTGSFSALRLDPPATAHFRFIDDADWSVHVLDEAHLVLPWWPDARGVWRGARLIGRFELRRR